MEAGSRRQLEERDAAGRDVLSHRAGRHRETGAGQLVVQLTVDEVHLPQVRLRGIPGDPRPVLHRRPAMRVPLDAETDQETDRRPVHLADTVGRLAAYGGDDGVRRGSTRSGAVDGRGNRAGDHLDLRYLTKTPGIGGVRGFCFRQCARFSI